MKTSTWTLCFSRLKSQSHMAGAQRSLRCQTAHKVDLWSSCVYPWSDVVPDADGDKNAIVFCMELSRLNENKLGANLRNLGLTAHMEQINQYIYMVWDQCWVCHLCAKCIELYIPNTNIYFDDGDTKVEHKERRHDKHTKLTITLMLSQQQPMNSVAAHTYCVST